MTDTIRDGLHVLSMILGTIIVAAFAGQVIRVLWNLLGWAEHICAAKRDAWAIQAKGIARERRRTP